MEESIEFEMLSRKGVKQNMHEMLWPLVLW
jgi:hypothetical protein